jgi:hydroxymethylpyrimidine/phosphomethylpyrimidine kinase
VRAVVLTPPMRAVLTIAGSDSGAGAGIQADLKTFAALGVYGTSAITAITAQNTTGVTASLILPADMVTAQIEAVAADIELHATKTGMLGTAAVVEAVAAAIEELELPKVVVDPVMVAKSGDRLLDEDGVRAMCAELLPRALVVTPNIPEAEALAGHAIRSRGDLRDAVRRIHDRGRSAVIVTGGHAAGDEIIDVLFDGTDFREFPTPRIQTRNTHGTGCTFASAIAVHLALGHALADATARAQAYVIGAIRHGLAIGRGHGPLDHFWQLREKTARPL